MLDLISESNVFDNNRIGLETLKEELTSRERRKRDASSVDEEEERDQIEHLRISAVPKS